MIQIGGLPCFVHAPLYWDAIQVEMSLIPITQVGAACLVGRESIVGAISLVRGVI